MLVEMEKNHEAKLEAQRVLNWFRRTLFLWIEQVAISKREEKLTQKQQELEKSKKYLEQAKNDFSAMKVRAEYSKTQFN